MFPKISIITPSLNQAQFLEQTILSVLNQNYANLEYIIVDGGSTDGSIDIIKKYEKQLAYWVSEKDKGQTDAINKGFEKTTGEIINWLNSDDYYEKGALETIADAFSDNSTKIVSACGRVFNSEDNQTLNSSRGVDIYSDNLAKTIGWARMDQPETFFRKSALVNLMPLSIDLNFLMDRKLWMDYLLAYGVSKVKKIEKVVVNFRIHSGSKTFAHGSLFEEENNTLFYALSKQYSLSYYEKIIGETLSIKKNLSVRPFPAEHPSIFIEEVLNYFLLLRGNEYYFKRENGKAGRIFNTIRVELLAREDKALYKRLTFKNKYIPASLLNILSKNFSH